MNNIRISHKYTFFRKIVWSSFYFIMACIFLYAFIYNNNITFFSKILELLMFFILLIFGLLCLFAVDVSFDNNSLFIKGFINNYLIDISQIKDIQRFLIYFYLIKLSNKKLHNSYIVIFATNNAMMSSTKEKELLKKLIKEKQNQQNKLD